MDLMTIIIIAIGLSMDAFAVAVSNGVVTKKFNMNFALKISIFFGSFQAIMPVIGWLLGLSIKDYIEKVDHWIAFGLLLFLGCKMIYESFVIDENENKKSDIDLSTIIIMSIATSIDALAVGVTFSFLNVGVLLPVILIGLITFVLSLFGVFLGTRFGKMFENKIEILGGLILIGIGTKILLEHLL